MPLVPVTVIVVVPTVAVTVAENVADTLQFGVQVGGPGVKTALTPDGRADRLKVTGAATPEVRVALRVSAAPGPPGRILRDAGVAARLKLKAQAQTTNVKVVVLVRPPPTP